ncbi:hypothetical protein U3516DRAFT_778292 [Neocallimastix sp. 'constans']
MNQLNLNFSNSAKQELMFMVDDILLTSKLPKADDINVLAKKCYKENPSFGAWELRISYITDGMESNQLQYFFIVIANLKNSGTVYFINIFVGNRKCAFTIRNRFFISDDYNSKIMKYCYKEQWEWVWGISPNCISPVTTLPYSFSWAVNVPAGWSY